MKSLILALSLMLAASPVMASTVHSVKLTQSKEINYTPIKKNELKTTQAWGYVCRNGYYYCVLPYSGPVGTGCCGCGFCGLWSLW